MAVALAGLFGAGFVVKNRTVDEPLKAVYAGAPAVESYTFTRDDDQYTIQVRLKDTADLQAAYEKLNADTKKVLRAEPYTIKLEDHRNQKLEAVSHRVNLYVQEALATGEFATMADRIEQEAAKAGVTAHLTVDNDRVYVQMHDQGAYLYSVVDRHASEKSARTEGGLGL